MRSCVAVVLLVACVGSDGSRDDPARPGDDLHTDGPVDSPDPPPPETDEPGHDTDARDPALFVVGMEVPCDDPAPLRFDLVSPGGAWADQPVFPHVPARFAGGGVTVVDLDDDGVTDVLTTSVRDGFRWYALAPEGAVDRTGELPPIPEDTSAVIPVDVDGDGDLDLHVVVWLGADLLLLRTEDGWVDVAAERGLAGPAGEHSVTAAWGDADGDGDLDVFVAAYGPMSPGLNEPSKPGDPSRLLIQQADGTFVDLVPALHASHALQRAHTFLGAWMQLDDDPAQELYVVNDFGWNWANGAYEVRGDRVFELGPYGFEARGSPMGLGLGDLNGDGREELVMPELEGIYFYVSGPGGWFSAATSVGLVPDPERRQVVGWGAELADLDHDGDLDVVAAFGNLDDLQDVPRNERDAAFLREGARFVDRAVTLGLDQGGVGRGLVVTDVDGDGWLDVVKQDLWGPVTIHRARCGEGAWLDVTLRQPGPNTRAIGARVVVEDDGFVASGTVRAGGTGYASAGPPSVHLGLGARDTVARLVVHWPDGTVDVATDLPTRRAIRVVRGEDAGGLTGSP